MSKCDLLGNGDLESAISYTAEQIKHELGISATVHPVSALSNYWGVLDRFFGTTEPLPRFEKARALREASIARKIGALREAIMAAIDGNLRRERRESAGPDKPDLESLLRVVAGEVGEQHTVLDQEFRRLGGMPDIVLDAVATRAIGWIGSSSENQVSSLQLSEWIHEIVGRLVQPSLEGLRKTGQRAVGQLQDVASRLGRSDAPSQEDFGIILREMPRFELAALPDSISAGYWKFGGKSILRARMVASLQERTGAQLEQALYLYAIALSQWSAQTVRKLEALFNSYADAYRLQIQGIAGTADLPANRAQLEADVEVLRNWTPLHA